MMDNRPPLIAMERYEGNVGPSCVGPVGTYCAGDSFRFLKRSNFDRLHSQMCSGVHGYVNALYDVP